MRLVLDTNVLIAAFITRGICTDLFEHCARHHILVTSGFILNELHEQLTGKFKFAPEEASEVIKLLSSRMLVVEPADLSAPVCRDPDDDEIIATAVAGNCDCVITGDKDLLVVQRFGGIEILSPREFLGYEASR